LDFIHHSKYKQNDDIPEAGFCFCLQIKIEKEQKPYLPEVLAYYLGKVTATTLGR
jgi:hypothetical protein